MHEVAFASVIGHEEAKAQLAMRLATHAIGQPLLFTGPEGIGKRMLAWAFAAQCLQATDPAGVHLELMRQGYHPDVYSLRVEGKGSSHTVQSVRRLIEQIQLPPSQAIWKVCLIDDADRFSVEAANALLKTLEEPPLNTLFLLIARSTAVILPTIVSRCGLLSFNALSQAELGAALSHHQVEKREKELIVRQANGSMGQALRLINGGLARQQQLLKLLSQGMLIDYRMLQETLRTIEESVEHLRKEIEERGRKELPVSYADLSIAHQQVLQREWEGRGCLAVQREGEALISLILSWYRDLNLCLWRQEEGRLMHPEWHMALEQEAQRGNLPPLDRVWEAVEEAVIAFSQATPLSLCLEHLFLKFRMG